jgi:hypothetical protein
MADADLPDQIARLEADIDQLAQTLDRCRKAMAFAKVAIAGGAIWTLASVLGLIGFDSAAIVGAIAAIIGGVVIYGSNSSTSKEAVAAMKDAERLRTELIDRINPQTVAGSPLLQ